MSNPTPNLQRGIVKQVLSGDTIIIRGPPRGGPPPERTIGLSNVMAPRLARRPGGTVGTESQDEPFAWEAREYLRKKLVGKEVCFTVEYKSGSGKEFGFVYTGKDNSGENVTESLIAEGLVDLKRTGLKANDENHARLVQLEDSAKAALKGKWGSPEEINLHVRDVKWTLANPRHFVEANKGQELDAVIEHVRDGCTVRAFLLPSFQYVTVMLSGIKCPMFKIEDEKTVPEEYAEEAKYFTEVRLLQRDVKVILEGASNQNLLGTIIHPNGNISELLLQEGFARCADWSIKNVTDGIDKMRRAEKYAKEKKLRMWKNFQPLTQTVAIKDKNYTAKVVEIVNGDSLIVKMGDGSFNKIFLSSIRPPRPMDSTDTENIRKRDPKARVRPLYDIPYMFEAREFLRKKLIGKKVNVEVDYVQPKSSDFPEKTCCTITINNINVAEALVSKGLATVVRYRQDDDQRSSCYDDLLKAEDRAEKKAVGVHSKKDFPVIRVADISGDVSKAKQFLPFLQRAGKAEALVEFVASGSRLRLYIPKETCLITLLLSGIDCPKAARTVPGTNVIQPGDDFGDAALAYTKELCMQREVQVEVEGMDKGGNFIGWLYLDGLNLSVGLVEEGLAKVHFTAERSSHYKILQQAQTKAKEKKLNLWSMYEEPKEVFAENEVLERKINYKTVIVTEITPDCHIYVQNTETGPHLDALMDQMRNEFVSNPPLQGSYTPKKGDLCAAKFTDGEWYRVKVEKVTGNKASILYIDFGNKETTDTSKLATLPSTYQLLPSQAQEYALACVTLPKDEEDIQIAVDALNAEALNNKCILNVEYKSGNLEFVTLCHADSKNDIALTLIAEGLILVEQRQEIRLSKLVAQYQKAEDKAKEERKNLWRYGDFTEDDAKDFGYRQ
jgi:staphylococcal nuclease domain-containing protein 1